MDVGGAAKERAKALAREVHSMEQQFTMQSQKHVQQQQQLLPHEQRQSQRSGLAGDPANLHGEFRAAGLGLRAEAATGSRAGGGAVSRLGFCDEDMGPSGAHVPIQDFSTATGGDGDSGGRAVGTPLPSGLDSPCGMETADTPPSAEPAAALRPQGFGPMAPLEDPGMLPGPSSTAEGDILGVMQQLRVSGESSVYFKCGVWGLHSVAMANLFLCSGIEGEGCQSYCTSRGQCHDGCVP